jgi:EAL domain-containing protein (putative c-di-GMP-specific phosphodiesterase class I)/GGDEF domain-containing protein
LQAHFFSAEAKIQRTEPSWLWVTLIAIFCFAVLAIAQALSVGAQHFTKTAVTGQSSPFNQVLLIWPASALSVAFGYYWRVIQQQKAFKVLCACALGTAAWGLVFYRSLPLALTAALLSVVGPWIAMQSLRRFGEWKPLEDSLDRTGRLVLALLFIAAPINASLATLAGQLIPGVWPTSGQLWLKWWLVDGLGMLLVTPPLLIALGNVKAVQGEAIHHPGFGSQINAMSGNEITTGKLFDLNAFGLVAGGCIGLFSLFFAILQMPFHAHAVLFLVFPLVAWLGLQCRSSEYFNSILPIGLALLASRAAQTRLSHENFLAGFNALDASVLVFAAVLSGLLLHAVAQDRTLAIARLVKQAREDYTTGLLNDRGLNNDLDSLLAQPNRNHYGMIGIHLTNFDALTDLCGSMQAQQLEQSVAKKLKQLPNAYLAARISAGRYVLLVQADSIIEIRTIARQLYVQTTEQSFKTENGSLRLQACIGGLMIDRKIMINSEECISALANTQAIAASVRDPQLFVEPLSQTMIDARRTHAQQIEVVRDAIRERRLELYAQPIVHLNRATQGVSYEVLSRLRARDGRMILPPEFIPLTVQAQMSVALDRQVVEQTFAWLAANPIALKNTAKCSINLSGLTLSDTSIASYIFSQRVLHDLPADKIVFEITEGEAIRNPAAASRLVDQLKAEGFGIALDDFGTGLATFEYLKRFSIDYLKIDGSFVRSLKANSIDEEIVRATIRVAKHLNVVTVAEHVHHQGVLDLLHRLGIDCIQGAIVGMPVPINEVFSLAQEMPLPQLAPLTAPVVQAPIVV